MWRPTKQIGADSCTQAGSDAHVGIYRSTGDEALFHEARAPTRDELQGLLEKIVMRLMRLLTRRGYLVEEQGMTYRHRGR